MVVLLGQLLQRLLEAHALLPLRLQRFLPALAVGLSQRQEVPAGLRRGENTTSYKLPQGNTAARLLSTVHR